EDVQRVSLRRLLSDSNAPLLQGLERPVDVVRLEDQPGHASDPTARVALPRDVRPERDSARVIHGQLHSFVLVDEFEAQRLRVKLPRLVMVRHVHGAHQEFSNDGFRHLPSSIPRGTETPLTVGAAANGTFQDLGLSAMTKQAAQLSRSYRRSRRPAPSMNCRYSSGPYTRTKRASSLVAGERMITRPPGRSRSAVIVAPYAGLGR